MLTRPIPRRVISPVRGMRLFRRSKTPSSPKNASHMSENGRGASKSDLRTSVAALVAEALPCLDVAPRSADPAEGLTTMLSVDARNRTDVLDLDRAFFMTNGGTADVSWLSLPPNTGETPFRVLLRVAVTAPVQCHLVVVIPIERDDRERRARQLAYLLAADRLALGFDVPITAESAIRIASPTDRRPLVAALDALGCSATLLGL